ncbi:unnamed protein product [Linum tenue]|uniref:Uncharacterized protein n=1 Tax=Linum tenue TaxID=586396 RepID=A0AAV0M8G9_9ROSI|nr:unnamed protein product [Linum tenue]
MEENCSPHSAIGWEPFYQDEQVMEEFRQYVLYTSELETTLLSAREEIAKRELEILRLKELLSSTTKERNDARLQCLRLMFEHKEAEEQSPPSVLLSTAAATAPVFSSTSTSPNEQLAAGGEKESSPPETHHHHRGSVVEELAADRMLPEKGKLLQAVKEAGPLLQTLLLAGPLPQWQHPPPQLDAVEIPPVTIASSLSPSSSPSSMAAARLIHQESFNSSSSPFGVKRSIAQLCDSSASPGKKYHKIEILTLNPNPE